MSNKETPLDTVAFNVIVSDSMIEVLDDNYSALKMAIIDKDRIERIPTDTWNDAGFYILLSGLNDDNSYNAYIGKAPAGVRNRIEQHTRGKDFWKRAIMIKRDTTNGFTSAEVAWLEAKFYDIFQDAELITIENAVRPVEDTLPPYVELGLARIQTPVIRILDLLGYKLNKPDKTRKTSNGGARKTQTYRSNTTLKDLLDTNIITSGAIFSAHSKYPAEAELLPNGTIKYKDTIYTSLSTVGGTVIKETEPEGNHPNGWTFWQMEDEDSVMKPLSEYRRIYEEKI